MAIDVGRSDSSEEVPDSEVEEQPSQQSEQQKAVEYGIHGNVKAPIKLPRNPADSLPEERDKRWRTHWPYRAW